MRKIIILICFLIPSIVVFSQDLTASVVINDVTCHGACDGGANITATGGTGAYSYSLYDSNGTIISTSSSNFFTNICPGNYTVNVLDSGNNTYQTSSFIINEPTQIEMTLITTSSGNQPSGVIEITAIGGTPPYNYSIGGNMYTSTNIFSDLTPGSYVVSVIDSIGCLVQMSTDITSIDVDNGVNRNGNELSTNITAETYQWINADTQIKIDGATNKNYVVTEMGNYRVEMTKDIADKNTRKRTVQRFSSPTYQVASLLGINDVNYKYLQVYPNPSSDYLILSDRYINKQYKIFNTLGKEIYSGKILSSKISIQNLSQGIFYLQIKGLKILKFVKN